MSDIEMQNEGGSEKLHELVEEKMKAAFARQKEELPQEIGSLFDKISATSNFSRLKKLDCLLASDTPKFKRKSNEEQFCFNTKVSLKLSEAEQSLELKSAQALEKLAEGVFCLIIIIIDFSFEAFVS